VGLSGSCHFSFYLPTANVYSTETLILDGSISVRGAKLCSHGHNFCITYVGALIYLVLLFVTLISLVELFLPKKEV